MTSNYKFKGEFMQELGLLQDDEIVSKGSIIRLYEVGRFDIMKSSLDRKNSKKKAKDFYEYIVVDCSVIKDNTFFLINVTRDNPNRGTILCVFNEIDEQLTALQLKKYFGSNAKVFIDLTLAQGVSRSKRI